MPEYRKKPEVNNKYRQLVTDLKNGDLCLKDIEMAYNKHTAMSKYMPEEVKDIVCGTDSDSITGMIFRHFKLLRTMLADIEIAYRRGKEG